MKRITKRLLSVIMAVVMILSASPLAGFMGIDLPDIFTTKANAASYNRDAAVSYAAAHWNDGVGQCAQFVSACITAGGISVSQKVCLNLWNTLKNYGTPYKLTVASNDKIKLSSNSGKVERGDPLFYVCETCGGTSGNSAFPHVVFCGGTDSSGYLTAYAHNAAWNNKTMYSTLNNSSHPSHKFSVYSIHINETKKLSVYFNANGGSVVSDTYTVKSDLMCNKSDSSKVIQTWTYNNKKENGLMNASTFGLSKEGYTFAGWGTEPDGGTVFDQNDPSLKPSDINPDVANQSCSTTLYAQWAPNKLNVYFNSNGGSVSSDTYTLKSNLICNKSDSSEFSQKWTYDNSKDYGILNPSTFGLSKAGYTFAGWGTEPNGGTVFDQNDPYLKPSDINPDVANQSCSITLYAVWEKITYTLSYNANGGSDAPSAQSGNTSYIISNTEPTRSGYTFLGWSISSSETSANYTAGNTINLTQNTTLYAIWQKNAETDDNIDEDTLISIQSPSTTTINYGDSIILHADVTGTLPTGAKIVWDTPSNGNFYYEVSADGTTCTISPKNSGETTFKIKVIAADGVTVLAEDEQTMISKAGFFQKIIAFFKMIFGLSRVIPQAFEMVI